MLSKKILLISIHLAILKPLDDPISSGWGKTTTFSECLSLIVRHATLPCHEAITYSLYHVDLLINDEFELVVDSGWQWLPHQVVTIHSRVCRLSPTRSKMFFPLKWLFASKWLLVLKLPMTSYAWDCPHPFHPTSHNTVEKLRPLDFYHGIQIKWNRLFSNKRNC